MGITLAERSYLRGKGMSDEEIDAEHNRPKDITPGEAFVSRMDVVDRMVKAGTPMFAALAAGLEDEDWKLVYVATRRMAMDIQELAGRVRTNSAPLPEGDGK